MEVPLPEPWCPIRPLAERSVGRPTRRTYPFLDNVRTLCQVSTNVVFCLPREGERERAYDPPQGYFTL
ncbi:unnamed protein product [Brassica rapa]|uniref:Uncharacterized protein n=1 Tax=Brassica campestris TaxID=3711 RepID=A0A8D9CQ69_BRACM|nr:unnamed protein product [Brassica rapa]